IQGGPLMHVIAAKAVAFKEAMEPSFKEYQHQIVRNARALAAGMADRGYHVVSGGTDTHLMLISLIERNLTGKAVEEALEKAGITVNKNTVPFDPQKPFVTSGIRMGTPALTTRGMKEPEMKEIAALIDKVVSSFGDEEVYAQVKQDILTLCQRFPLYKGRLEKA
ncbi:MAG: serine hydroxymethyltransferase, partial [Candidatus Zixiibacteriota bacterium]